MPTSPDAGPGPSRSEATTGTGASLARLRVEIQGAVQGVGFRPFVHGLAAELGLPGWVRNDGDGVQVEVEGPREKLASFEARIVADAPGRALIHAVDARWLEPTGCRGFEIRHSASGVAPTVVMLADGATCASCMSEVDDAGDRRHRYPFTNCTDCGPRFTIVRALPYDRPNTTMAGFELCEECRREYEDPRDRRFHAQPNACPVCGPRLELTGPDGAAVAAGDDALQQAAGLLREGRIVAVKGLGGFHLMVDADDEVAVRRLRERKSREEKPLALMVRDLDQARGLCEVSSAAARLLASPEAPIVLMPRRAEAVVADAVAPGQPRLGLMLPPSPLHHLLARAIGRPVVATSGNRSDEPICTSNAQALRDLGDIADSFLMHDRPIARHVDDSVVVLDGDGSFPLRRARGYAPLPVHLAAPLPCILALGGHLKSTIALSVGRNVFLSQHIGDLDTPRARTAFEAVIGDFLDMYGVQPQLLVHDMHPDYASSAWARSLAETDRRPAWAGPLVDVPQLAVQHHHAHLAACLAEHHHDGPALGVTWDGTGWGPDGTVWGGEFLFGDCRGYERVASLLPFRLPGGEAAVREPRRSALGVALEALGAEAWESAPGRTFKSAEQPLLETMLRRGVNAPMTTSAGRLFDAVAALLDVRQRTSFEGQAAMELEALAQPGEHGTYDMPLTEREGAAPALDWRPMIRALVRDERRGAAPSVLAARFHDTLAQGIAAVAERVGASTVALSGGCFLNLRLLERTRAALEAAGRRVLVHRLVPPGDGGISLGQIAVAAATLSPSPKRGA